MQIELRFIEFSKPVNMKSKQSKQHISLRTDTIKIVLQINLSIIKATQVEPLIISFVSNVIIFAQVNFLPFSIMPISISAAFFPISNEG